MSKNSVATAETSEQSCLACKTKTHFVFQLIFRKNKTWSKNEISAQGTVVRNSVIGNPGLSFNPLFWFMHF